MFTNIKEDNKSKMIEELINLILSTNNTGIIEIYAKDGSIINGSFGNWVGLMIETDPEFPNESLDDVLDIIEQKDFSKYDFRLVISTEPNDMERGHGTILWSKENK